MSTSVASPIALSTTNALSDPTVFRLTHTATLDGIRGVALIVVVLCHTKPMTLIAGAFGVDLFFVLSGFLITSILLNEQNATGSIDFKRFYIRRACRLLPALFLLVIFVIFWAFITEYQYPVRMANTYGDVVAVILYVWNWRLVWAGTDMVSHQSMFGHLWSLSIEEQFYLIWPFLIFAAFRSNRAFVFMGAVIVIGLAWPAFWRAYLWPGGFDYPLYFRSDTRLDGLMFGAASSWLLTKGYIPLHIVQSMAVRCLGLVCFIWFIYITATEPMVNGWPYLGGWTLVNLLSAIFISVAATYKPTETDPIKWFFEMPWLRWVGRISYGLYLWHVPGFAISEKIFPHNPFLLNVVAIAITLIVATISYYVLEKPFLRLKSRFAHG